MWDCNQKAPLVKTEMHILLWGSRYFAQPSRVLVVLLSLVKGLYLFGKYIMRLHRGEQK